jgi:hypothetical protein
MAKLTYDVKVTGLKEAKRALARARDALLHVSLALEALPDAEEMASTGNTLKRSAERFSHFAATLAAPATQPAADSQPGTDDSGESRA